MADNRIDGNLIITGSLVVQGAAPVFPPGTVTNAMIATAAGVSASKLQHQYELTYGQSGTAASVTIPFHVVRGATATLESISAGSVVAAIGGASVTVDIKKNGTSCLTGVITLDSGNTAYIPEAGSVSVSAAVADAVYTLVIAATAGGGTLPTGLFVTVKIREDAD